MYRIDGETGERVLITDSKPTNYLSQLSKQSLSHDLEELSQMIGFENGGLDSYLDMSGPFSMATEQNGQWTRFLFIDVSCPLTCTLALLLQRVRSLCPGVASPTASQRCLPQPMTPCRQAAIITATTKPTE